MAKKPAKKATPVKAPKPKASDSKPAAVKAAPKIFNNDDPEAKALFLQHLPKIKDLKERLNTANANLRNAYKSAKAQGAFEKADFDYAFQLETAEQEAKTRAKIARNLTIARYMGSDLGAQLDMFLEPVRTPAADRAYAEGETAAMQNETAKPVYAPETEQYRKYMEGYHSVQAKQVGKGIEKLHPDVEKDVKQTAAEKAKIKKQQDAKAFDAGAKEEATPVTSGVAMTRAEFEAQQQSSHFTKN